MKNKHILFTGGGTAGHVMVNLSLIPVFQNDGWTIDYIGSKNGIERKLIESLEDVTYYPISTGKLRRYMSLENVKDPFKILKGTIQAWRIIGKRKPAIIFSKGGFVSVPVVVAGKVRRKPVVIHESDYTPGLANKIAIPFAKKVLATFSETMDYLPEKKREYVGAIVRDALFQGNKSRGLEMSSLTNKKPVLLMMGGSSGAEKLNKIIRKLLPQLLRNMQVIHLCGKGHIDENIQQEGYAQFEYVNEELPDILAASDYVLSRAGANSIFEFLALNKPMLLIPLSRAASRGDQIINAKSFAKKKYARVIEEEELNEEGLLSELLTLQKEAPQIRTDMKKYTHEDTKAHVIDLLKTLAK